MLSVTKWIFVFIDKLLWYKRKKSFRMCSYWKRSNFRVVMDHTILSCLSLKKKEKSTPYHVTRRHRIFDLSSGPDGTSCMGFSTWSLIRSWFHDLHLAICSPFYWQVYTVELELTFKSALNYRTCSGAKTDIASTLFLVLKQNFPWAAVRWFIFFLDKKKSVL